MTLMNFHRYSTTRVIAIVACCFAAGWGYAGISGQVISKQRIAPNSKISVNSTQRTMPAKTRSAVSKKMTLSGIAGEYTFGDGLSVNSILKIRRDETFSYQLAGYQGVVDEIRGTVSLRNGLLKLAPSDTGPRDWPSGMGPTLVPVPWGQRMYLIPPSLVSDFASAVSSGEEPSSQGFQNRFFLREGDWDKPANGQPEVPAQWSRLFKVERHHSGRIISPASEQFSGAWKASLAQESPVMAGMSLYACSPDFSQSVTVVVEDANGHECTCVENPAQNTNLQGWTLYARPPIPRSGKD